jgi:SAM-dependent methyltransferase
MTFRDHFSASAPGYAAFRPDYPPALFSWLASQAPATELAWDCGTGSGQAAVALATHFTRVIATDASSAQLAAAAPHERVEYRCVPAEDAGLVSGSIDLATAAQAVHWFDLRRYYDEVRRVLAPNGVIALWGYSFVEIEPMIDALLARFYAEDVGEYWTPERRLVDDRYSTIEFPFMELHAPPFAIERKITLAGLAGYLRTWSATQRFIQARGSDPVAGLERELAPLWGAPDAARTARWPIFLRVGRS